MSPFRLSEVDTAVGADTIAPDTTQIVSASAGDGTAAIAWTEVTTDENGNALGDFEEYRIYRDTRPLLTNWKDSATVVTTIGIRSDTDYTDNNVSNSDTYYYRVTAVDNATLENESFFSDTVTADPQSTGGGGPVWYVNDGDTSGDFFTTEPGSDMNTGASDSPFRTVQYALNQVAPGDTVKVDVGTYGETVTIDTDALYLIGADSSTSGTVLDYGDSTSSVGAGIYVHNAQTVVVESLRVVNGFNGVEFNNVVRGRARDVTVDHAGNHGFSVTNQSDSVELISNMTMDNNASGFYISNSETVGLEYNLSRRNGANGYALDNSTNHVGIDTNTARRNTSNGFYLGTGVYDVRLLNNMADGQGVGTYGYESSGTGNFFIVRDNVARNYSSAGFRLASLDFATVVGNRSASNALNGFLVFNSSNIRELTGNIAINNGSASSGAGFYLNSVSGSPRVQSNVARENYKGFRITDSNMTFFQNEVYDNLYAQVSLESGASADTFSKNIIRPGAGADTLVANAVTTDTFDFTNNWWSRTDRNVIRKGVRGSGADSVQTKPYRLGVVDTGIGADTIAPERTDIVSVEPGDGTAAISWNTVQVDENGNALGDFEEYRIYRDTSPLLSDWKDSATLVGTNTDRFDTDFLDSSLTNGETYYYRVTSVDNSVPENEAFFSDTSAVQPRADLVAWYINDDDQTGDEYTTATGNNLNDGTADSPLRTISYAMQFVDPGDTVWVDAGTYGETVDIPVNNLALIGSDSSATKVNAGESTVESVDYAAIMADTQDNLLVKNIQGTNGAAGLYFDNVDQSKIVNVKTPKNGYSGVKLTRNSQKNTLTNLSIKNTREDGLAIIGSDSNTVEQLVTSQNGFDGVYLENSNLNTLRTIETSSNDTSGIALLSSNHNTLRDNSISGNAQEGLELYQSDQNILRNNSSYATISGEGFSLNSSDSNFLSRNVSRDNADDGFELQNTSHNNRLVNNVSLNNSNSGIVLNSSNQNYLAQNTVLRNTRWQFALTNTSASNRLTRNNVAPSSTNPDSGLVNSSGNTHQITRDHWNTTDLQTLRASIDDSVNSFAPFRLGKVDTGVGADTVAPDTTDFVSVSAGDGTAALAWSEVTTNGNGNLIGDFDEYRIYRDTRPFLSNWKDSATVVANISSKTDTDFLDSGLNNGDTYYYRITAVDDSGADGGDGVAGYENESFFSDTSGARPAHDGPTWFVNDTYDGTEEFTTAAGDDSNSGGPDDPFRTITKAITKVSAGDTVKVDVGTYGETVTIPVDNLALIGSDSSPTGSVIDYGDSTSTTGAGIYADTQTKLLVKNLRVEHTYNGIDFLDVDTSTITNVASVSNGNEGIFLRGNSNDNVISNNLANNNSHMGFLVKRSSYNQLERNIGKQNQTRAFGIRLSSDSNTIVYNRAVSNQGDGIRIRTGSYNILKGNIFRGNTGTGIDLKDIIDGNYVYNNVITNNSDHGVRIRNSDNNRLAQNTIHSNSPWQVIFHFGPSSGNIVTKNNITDSSASNDSGLTNDDNSTVKITRNYWQTTDRDVLSSKVNDSVNSPIPFRLGKVDTGVGADTITPDTTDIVSVSAGDGTAAIAWNEVTTDENGNLLSDFAEYRVYRDSRPLLSDWKDSSTLVTTISSRTDTSYTDSGLSNGDTYYYRVTAVDNATPENESFFSDTSGARPAHDGPTWFVNDTYDGSEEFTTAAGYDTNSGGPEEPFRTISKAMTKASAGDTVKVDVGTYGETVAIPVDNLALIGADSTSTVIDYGDSSAATAAKGLYADTQTELLVSNLRIENAWEGVSWLNISNSRISEISVTNQGVRGVKLKNSSGNTIARTKLYRNGKPSNTGGNGLMLRNADKNLIKKNEILRNDYDGINFNQSQKNVIHENKIIENQDEGLDIGGSSHKQIIARNLIKKSENVGIKINSSDTVFISANAIVSNDSWAIDVSGGRRHVIEKNNIRPSVLNSDSGLVNSSGNIHKISYNYWNSTNRSIIDKSVDDPINQFKPFRLGAVDTGVGADTIAPDTTDIVSVSAGDGTAAIAWNEVTTDENGNSLNDFGKYRIYRDTSPLLTDWKDSATIITTIADRTDTKHLDSTVSNSDTYYYRVTAVDNANLENESFFSDTVTADPESTGGGGPVWYVNDGDTSGDFYTSKAGSDMNSGASDSPFRSISYALKQTSVGDTIKVDVGTYGETIAIDTDALAIVGVDSSVTTLDYGDSSSAVAIAADTQTGLTISSLGIKRYYSGLEFENVDKSNFKSVNLTRMGGISVLLNQGSDTNLVRNMHISDNDGEAIAVIGSDNTIRSNRISDHTLTASLLLVDGSSNRVINNKILNSGYEGIDLGDVAGSRGPDNTVIKHNTVRNSRVGIDFDLASNSRVTQNEISDNTISVEFAENNSFTPRISKNNFQTTSDTLVNAEQALSDTQSVSKNWWGTTDEYELDQRIRGSVADSVTVRPYRLGKVDTAAGADTIAPDTTDIVSVTPGDGTAAIEWSTVETDENGNAISDFEAYRVYRDSRPLLTDWKDSATVVATVTDRLTTGIVDSGLNNGDTYYYRVTSVDNATPENEAFFSDSSAVRPLPDLLTWYVNDTYDGSEEFTTAAGDDFNLGTSDSPFRTVSHAMTRV
ncbi:MAG: right-handed parallel beta-helix repeat-containing protein, partial [bacterium]